MSFCSDKRMRNSYNTILCSLLIMCGCDSQKTDPPSPTINSSNISKRIEPKDRERENKEDEITKQITKNGYVAREPFSMYKFSQRSISAVTFQTIKNDTFKKLAKILYGDSIDRMFTEEVDKNLIFHQKNFDSDSIVSKGFTDNVQIPGGLRVRTYLYTRKISSFTNKYPERDLQVLSNTGEYLSADHGYAQEIESIPDLLMVGRHKLPFVTFNTVKGDSLEKLADILYKDVFSSYYCLAFPEVYENPQIKEYHKEQSLPAGLQVRTFMFPYQYTAFTNRFPERKAQIIPPELSSDLTKILSRNNQ